MAGFLVTSLFVHRIMSRYITTLVIAIGFLFSSVAIFLIGPSYLLRSLLPNDLLVIMAGLLLLGFASPFTCITTYSEIHDSFVSVKPDCDRDKLNDILSGLFNAAFSLGVFIGPMVGSYLTIWYQSFRICSDFFAIGTFMFVVLLIVFVYIPLRIKLNQTNQNDKESIAMCTIHSRSPPTRASSVLEYVGWCQRLQEGNFQEDFKKGPHQGEDAIFHF